MIADAAEAFSELLVRPLTPRSVRVGINTAAVGIVGKVKDAVG